MSLGNITAASWNMDQDGVATVYVTFENGTRTHVPVCDVWRKPIAQVAPVAEVGPTPHDMARAAQIAIVEIIVAALRKAATPKPSGKTKWACPIGVDECEKHCGSYGCGG